MGFTHNAVAYLAIYPVVYWLFAALTLADFIDDCVCYRIIQRDVMGACAGKVHFLVFCCWCGGWYTNLVYGSAQVKYKPTNYKQVWSFALCQRGPGTEPPVKRSGAKQGWKNLGFWKVFKDFGFLGLMFLLCVRRCLYSNPATFI